MASRGRPKGQKAGEKERAARMAPRAPRGAAKEKRPNETLDEATLRLQRARADTEELDRAKRQLELDKAQGLLVSKEEAVDITQQALLIVCQIFDMLPERLRDRLDPSQHNVCEILDDIIREARTEVANG